MKNPMELSLTQLLLVILIGFVAGILGGMVGIGGGIVIVPALVMLLGFTQHQAQGSSLVLLMLPVGILGVYNYYQQGHITMNTFKLVLILAVGFVVGSYFGSKIAVAIDVKLLRKLFAGFIMLVALKMLFDK
jgi:uncharacterized membrane protein YfcA